MREREMRERRWKKGKEGVRRRERIGMGERRGKALVWSCVVFFLLLFFCFSAFVFFSGARCWGWKKGEEGRSGRKGGRRRRKQGPISCGWRQKRREINWERERISLDGKGKD